MDQAWFSGQCGCGGAGTGTHEYRYETNGSYTDNSGYDTAWCRRTSIERLDGSWLTQYFDETGQALSRLITDADPANTGPQPGMWVDQITRNSDGVVTTVGTPASVSGYTHSSGSISAASSAGLVWVHSRDASGDDKNFLVDLKYRQGSGGTEYLERSYTWDVSTALKEIGTSTGIYVRRPLMTGDRVYNQEITSGTTGIYLTSYSYTSYSGASPTSQPLAIEEITQTSPAVSTGNNGSNSATTLKTHLRKDGCEDFVGRTDGTNRIIEYTEYTNDRLKACISEVGYSHRRRPRCTYPQRKASQPVAAITQRHRGANPWPRARNVPEGRPSSLSPISTRPEPQYEGSGRLLPPYELRWTAKLE